MTYEQARAEAQQSIVDAAIEDLIGRYQTGRPTIVFLPGGMASALNRGRDPYAGTTTIFDYDDIWLALAILFGGAADLRMAGDVDLDNRFVIADGPIELLHMRMYGTFRAWCQFHGYNVLILGWDWRLRLGYGVNLLSYALDRLRLRVQQDICASEDIADNLVLVGHSFGGMILKLYLNGGGDMVARMRLAVTIGSPFYGYGGQLPRYFMGQSLLNETTSATEMAQVIASLRGPYTLMFLDHALYLANKAGLAADADDPLATYPVTDAPTGQPVDAYTQAAPPSGGPFRYPPQGWVDLNELQYALAVNQQVAAPLPAAVAPRLHHFRGIQTDAQQQPLQQTVRQQTWATVTGGFNPNNPADDPITDLLGVGDSTIPAWSARLLSTPAANVHTFSEPLEHMFLMEHPSILQALGTLIEPGKPAGSFKSLLRGLPPPTGLANPRDARQWLRASASSKSGVLSDAVAGFPVGVDSLLRRIFADAVKR